jgi:hypothetical protein
VLLKLQAEYAAWLAALPESLRDSPSAQVLEDIVNLDLDSLAEIELPRVWTRLKGYRGRSEIPCIQQPQSERTLRL